MKRYTNSPNLYPEDGYNSEHLDESEDEKPTKKRKMTKAAEAKAKAAAKAEAKKKKGDEDEDSEEEDPYNALSKMWKDTSKPPVGSFENCARCNKEFTVVCAFPNESRSI